jgi:NADPH:quinone reductase-like Zn-dependent oxidoreductase
MRAFVLDSYGSPESLTLTHIDRPEPAHDEVLVRVHATSVNPYDWHHLRGEPYVARLMPGGFGLRRPGLHILGGDVAGQVEAVGRDVTKFRPGDDVFALVPGGGFGEYASVREDLLAPKPKNLSYDEAAAVPMAAITALLSVRDEGRIQPGQRVLVNGASGGVGTFAVQLARAFGAEVVGVCSAANEELVRSIGAHDVVDYATEDFTRSARRYDLVLDCAGSQSISACLRVLERTGAFVVVGGQAGRWLQPAGRMFSSLALKPFVSQRMAMTDTVRSTEHRQNLLTLTELIEDGRVRPVIDRRYSFEEIPAAVAFQEAGHARGKVVVTGSTGSSPP